MIYIVKKPCKKTENLKKYFILDLLWRKVKQRYNRQQKQQLSAAAKAASVVVAGRCLLPKKIKISTKKNYRIKTLIKLNILASKNAF